MIVDVLTATRAEYGLMKPLLKRMIKDSEIELRLIVSGTHLSKEYGYTCSEIEEDDIPIYKKIPILSNEQEVEFISKTMANAMIRFSEHFLKDRPDFVIIDGDRYEALAVAIAAVNSNVPIIHIGGGATTEGAVDEYYRHAITKLSYLHFPSIELHRKRIIQMGESPERVFAVGSLGIESILQTKMMCKEELQKSLEFTLDKPYALATFHPVTLEDGKELEQLEELLVALSDVPDMKFIFTASNSDTNGFKINNRLEHYAKENKNVLFVKSLGSLSYFSALSHCEFVIGNSSSGIIEVPSFGIPTINIGDRQRGRLQAQSVLNCLPIKKDILETISMARSDNFKKICQNVINPYGDAHTSEKILKHLKEHVMNNLLNLKKKFFDLSFSI